MLTMNPPHADAISGSVVFPGDAEWDGARQAFNLMVDQRPAAVAFPVDERDVAAVIRFASDNGHQVAAQATGHNAGPLGSLSETVLLNTSLLTDVRIDAAARRVRVGAGTKWHQVTSRLSELGLAALHGSSSDVGIVGYSLGGGMGWLARRHGLQCNSVTAIELVTAEGDLIRTDAVHEPDLFWALRGGGGSFGVVTAIEFEVYPVTELYAGAMFFPFERAAEVLRMWNDLAPWLPDEVTSWGSVMHFPDLPIVPEPVRGGSFAVILAACLGDEMYGRRLLAPIRELGPVIDTFDMVTPSALEDLAMDPPDPLPYMTGHQIVGDLRGDTIDDVVAAVGPESGLVAIQLRQLGGAMARVPAAPGSRATLDGTTAMFAVGLVLDDRSASTVASSLQSLNAILQPAGVGEYPSFVEVPRDARSFYDASTWSRLQAIKGLYDPGDLFRGNHHIPLSR